MRHETLLAKKNGHKIEKKREKKPEKLPHKKATPHSRGTLSKCFPKGRYYFCHFTVCLFGLSFSQIDINEVFIPSDLLKVCIMSMFSEIIVVVFCIRMFQYVTKHRLQLPRNKNISMVTLSTKYIKSMIIKLHNKICIKLCFFFYFD